jgi:hypothetical protein
MPSNILPAAPYHGQVTLWRPCLQVEVDIRMQEGYDHSYFFISSFIADHINYHADALGA